MDVYISEKGGSRLALSMLPESISCSYAANMQVITVINGGDVQLPRGVAPSSFDWEGTLPGPSRKNASYIKRQHWRSPSEILSMFDKWRKNGKMLKLMVTETPINYDVYLNSYDAEFSGGNGDCQYSISLVSAKSLVIRTVGGTTTNVKTSAATTDGSSGSEKSSGGTYTVKPGDCLWSIAQQCLGAGSRYPEIYNLNKSKIDAKSKGTGYPIYTIYAGQTFTLPK